MSGGGTLGGKCARSNSSGDDDGDDWDVLAREERMAKKVRQGNVSQKAAAFLIVTETWVACALRLVLRQFAKIYARIKQKLTRYLY
ncbi:hypothetical protein FISHEDRAFT_73065 [Fistulina hepatica ATCC 64428]|uniref:Uncharacterized protein n=1 Tax=Fistulina hepatica ATCC 64428 TaxID=1128425 RepID=A0A0D7AE86_9AGAR|nr:hypothetical protein FISHEDRAFT_73065 [Fistulina hepatica ATCC 64428]